VTSPRLAALAGALIVAVATALAYVNATPSVFVLDDKLTVPPNLDRGLAALPEVFREPAWAAANTTVSTYRPLLVSSFVIEGSLWTDRAAAMHRTNVALHVLVTLFLFGLLESIRRRLAPATAEPDVPGLVATALAALLFGLHPIHTEIVNSIFNRSEMLGTLGVLAAIWGLVRWADTRPALAWGLAGLAYLFALLSRESAVTLPVLAALVLVTVGGPSVWRSRAHWIGLVTAAAVPLAVYALLRSAALSVHRAAMGRIVMPAAPDSTLDRVGQIVFTLGEATRMMLWPHPLRASYADLEVANVGPILLGLAALAAAAFATRRTLPSLAMGVAFFYLALMPSTRLLANPGSIELAAERYVYLPSVGLSLALLCPLVLLVRRDLWTTLTGAAVLLTLLGTLTFERNVDWRSEEALWRAQVAAAPYDGDGWMQLTTELLRLGKHGETMRFCREHLPTNASHAQFHNNCATAAGRLGQNAESEELYRKAIALGAGAVGHANLARHLARIGREGDALVEFEAAVEAEPNEAMRHVRRGEMLLHSPSGGVEAARAEFRAALAMDPEFSVAHDWLGRLARLVPGQ
jgi:tetratricopeptide (TPR) repeat protein